MSVPVMKDFSTPILFIIFNRPEPTAVVFEEIRKARPSRLFIAGDGPRAHVAADAENCARTRDIVKSIDWDCEVKTLFREKNMGCKMAVSSAIDWFFGHVEEGIILEDDCVPSASFFPFCQDMLERYRHDSRIMQVGGANILRRWKEDRQDYLFSYYGGVWGWATWRRAWKLYDVHMAIWADPAAQESLADIIVDRDQLKKRKLICDLVYNGKIDTWDYQWTFCKLVNSGLSITPSLNLVSNIGFSSDATHTTSVTELSNIERYEIRLPAKPNVIVVADRGFDAQFFKISGDSLITRIKNKVRSLASFRLKK